jgi:hypothetical protein
VKGTTTAVANAELDEGAKLPGEKTKSAAPVGEEARKPKRKLCSCT